MTKKNETPVFASPLKLETLVFKKKDNVWRAKITINHVDQMHDSMKAIISLNPEPFETEIKNIEDQIARGKAEPSLFGSNETKKLHQEVKDVTKDMEECIETFGTVEFQTTIEALAQKSDGHTTLTIFVPRDVIGDFMEKVNVNVDEKAQIAFYL